MISGQQASTCHLPEDVQSKWGLGCSLRLYSLSRPERSNRTRLLQNRGEADFNQTGPPGLSSTWSFRGRCWERTSFWLLLCFQNAGVGSDKSMDNTGNILIRWNYYWPFKAPWNTQRGLRKRSKRTKVSFLKCADLDHEVQVMFCLLLFCLCLFVCF